MTQIGEGIAIALARAEKDECIFCGKKHKDSKTEKVEPTKWKREKISGYGGNFVGKKKGIYPPGGPKYRTEGHHCLAFSAFIVDARKSPKDRFAALNHYLKGKSYTPNNDNNCIDLPGRKNKGQGKEANYYAFEEAVQAGYPLQLHIGGHVKDFMIQSFVLLQDIANAIVDGGFCEEPKKELGDSIHEDVIDAEDTAFKKTAAATSPWIAHPGPLKKAERFVLARNPTITEIKYPKL